MKAKTLWALLGLSGLLGLGFAAWRHRDDRLPPTAPPEPTRAADSSAARPQWWL